MNTKLYAGNIAKTKVIYLKCKKPATSFNYLIFFFF